MNMHRPYLWVSSDLILNRLLGWYILWWSCKSSINSIMLLNFNLLKLCNNLRKFKKTTTSHLLPPLPPQQDWIFRAWQCVTPWMIPSLMAKPCKSSINSIRWLIFNLLKLCNNLRKFKKTTTNHLLPPLPPQRDRIFRAWRRVTDCKY